jgi:Uncharacterized conserved protein
VNAERGRSKVQQTADYARTHRGVPKLNVATVRPGPRDNQQGASEMSVYRVTEVIGVSSESWEAAARSAVETAAVTVRELRIAEVVRHDVTIENGQITSYRVRLAISFKYESEAE